VTAKKQEKEMKMARLNWALAAVLVFGSQAVPGVSLSATQSAQTDNNIQAELQNQLKKFKDVQIQVNNGIVDLEGTAKDFATKEEIIKLCLGRHVAIVTRSGLRLFKA
jgi:BON domain-containing protein